MGPQHLRQLRLVAGLSKDLGRLGESALGVGPHRGLTRPRRGVKERLRVDLAEGGPDHALHEPKAGLLGDAQRPVTALAGRLDVSPSQRQAAEVA